MSNQTYLNAPLRTEPIDWHSIFKGAGIEPQRANLTFYPSFGHWALRMPALADTQIVVSAPALKSGEQTIRIVNGSWAFFA